MSVIDEIATLLENATDADTIEINAPPQPVPGKNVAFAVELGQLVARVMEPRHAVNRVVIRFHGGFGEVSFDRAKDWALHVDLGKVAAAIDQAKKPAN